MTYLIKTLTAVDYDRLASRINLEADRGADVVAVLECQRWTTPVRVVQATVLLWTDEELEKVDG